MSLGGGNVSQLAESRNMHKKKMFGEWLPNQYAQMKS